MYNITNKIRHGESAASVHCDDAEFRRSGQPASGCSKRLMQIICAIRKHNNSFCILFASNKSETIASINILLKSNLRKICMTTHFIIIRFYLQTCYVPFALFPVILAVCYQYLVRVYLS